MLIFVFYVMRKMKIIFRNVEGKVSTLDMKLNCNNHFHSRFHDKCTPKIYVHTTYVFHLFIQCPILPRFPLLYLSYAVRRGGVISKGIVAATGHKLYKTVLNRRSITQASSQKYNDTETIAPCI
ncbi:hypothetical protein QTP88_007190 [Uroleucon formosanum]